MTQQKIYIVKSQDTVKNAFISHIKNSFVSIKYLKKDYDLSDLHNLINIDNKILQKGTDQSTLFHKLIYSTFDKPNFLKTEFWVNYKKLCFQILNKIKNKTSYFGEWAIQRYPTIRFHFPNNVSVFEFHRDSNYLHPIGEINCFYALNECSNSSALHIEKNLGFEDYVPLNLKPGEYAILNTSIYKHGDFINKTGKTRVSMDFRFIPNIFLSKDFSSLTKKIEFTSDSYFINELEMKKLGH